MDVKHGNQQLLKRNWVDFNLQRDSKPDLVAALHPKRHNFSSIIGVRKISDEMRRTWKCIGHVLRKERNDDCMVAME